MKTCGCLRNATKQSGDLQPWLTLSSPQVTSSPAPALLGEIKKSRERELMENSKVRILNAARSYRKIANLTVYYSTQRKQEFLRLQCIMKDQERRVSAVGTAVEVELMCVCRNEVCRQGHFYLRHMPLLTLQYEKYNA